MMFELLASPAPTLPPPGSAAASAIAELWGMPLPASLALISLLSVVGGALVTGLVKKFRTPTDNREDRVVVFDASDRLIQRFEKLLADSDFKHQREIKELSAKVDSLEAEVEIMRQERSGMLMTIRTLILIAKRFGGAEAEREIRLLELPNGVIP